LYIMLLLILEEVSSASSFVLFLLSAKAFW